MDELSPLWIVGDDHECLCWVELLAEFDDALQVVIENVLVLQVEVAFSKAFLISFYHLEYNLLVVVWTLEEVLQITLSLYLFLALFHLE